MLYKFMSGGTTGDDYLDKLIQNYLLTGSTGDADWDKWLEPYKQYLPGPGKDPSLNRPSGDHPYYLTVTLKYKEALKEAELDRKDLDIEDILEKLDISALIEKKEGLN